MSKRAKFGIGFFVVLLVAGLVGLFFMTHEREEVEVEVPPEPEARLNPHLGLERFFDALKVEFRMVSEADEIDFETSDVLVVAAELATTEEWWRRASDRWVRRGGHLVVLESGFDDDETLDSRYEKLNFEVHDIGDFGVEDEAVYGYEYDFQKLRQPPEWRRIAREMEQLDEGDEEVGQKFSGPGEPDFVAVTDDEEWPLASSAGRGDGRVTVVVDADVWTNEGLKHGETGRLVAEILALGNDWPDEATGFVETDDWGWLGRLGKRSWPVFAGLLLLLGFALTRARRFGPPLLKSPDRRRRRADHIRATGRFLWNHRAREVLVEASREALIEKLTKRRPSIRTMDRRRRKKVMADELQIGVEELNELLEGPVPENGTEFQSMIAEIERRRRRL